MLSENFSNVIVLINSTNAMFLDNIDDRIDSLLYVGITGENGASAIPELLWGKVSPSGHLSDTFPTTPKADPVFANRNDYEAPVFQESIYFGYKWYETADKMGFWESDFSKNNFNIHNYEEAVFRPFGYGLSYSTFKTEIESIKINEQEINMNQVIDIYLNGTKINYSAIMPSITDADHDDWCWMGFFMLDCGLLELNAGKNTIKLQAKTGGSVPKNMWDEYAIPRFDFIKITLP